VRVSISTRFTRGLLLLLMIFECFLLSVLSFLQMKRFRETVCVLFRSKNAHVWAGTLLSY
jgi:hypothetical protein